MGAAVTVQPGAIELEDEKNLAVLPGDVVEPGSDKPDNEREFIIPPLPSRSPLLGWTLGVPVLWLYKPSFASEQDQVWTTGAMAFDTKNDLSLRFDIARGRDDYEFYISIGEAF